MMMRTTVPMPIYMEISSRWAVKTPISCPWHGDPNRSLPPRCLIGAFPQVVSAGKI
jgi:hypothetical protein